MNDTVTEDLSVIRYLLRMMCHSYGTQLGNGRKMFPLKIGGGRGF